MTTNTLPHLSGTHVALSVADRSQSTTFALLHEVRAETRAAIEAAIELAEKLGSAVARVARKATTKIDETTAQSLTEVERWLGGTLAKARVAAEQAATEARKAA